MPLLWLHAAAPLQEISAYNNRQLTGYRRYDVGFVFQFYNLVQNLTALENVELAAQICKEPLDAAEVLDPPRIFKIVVFPAPEAPTITQNSPFSISKFTSWRAVISTSPE